MKRMVSLKSLWVAVLCVGLAACATGPRIRSQTDPSADFSAYKTFGFLDEATGDKPAYSSFISQYLKKAVTAEMQKRGLSPSATPDLLVNFNLLTKDKVQVTESPSAYYGYRRGYAWGGGFGATTTDVSSYTEGTLDVDVVERSRMQLMWSATAIGRVRESAVENPEPAINSVIAQVFETFPRPIASVSTVP